jgi:hypothetical protein
MDFIYGLFSNEIYIWLFIVAVIYTYVGKRIGYKEKNKEYDFEKIVGHVVDSLIKQGYIKTEGTGKDTRMLKHWD